MTLAAFQPHHPLVQCSIAHGQTCNSPSASSGLVRSMTPGPIFPSSLGFPVNCGPKFSNLVLSWKRTEGLLMFHIVKFSLYANAYGYALIHALIFKSEQIMNASN